MIADATEEMQGSDRVPDLNGLRASRGCKCKPSTRAKRRSSPSARCSVCENCLTPPTLSERRYYDQLSTPLSFGVAKIHSGSLLLSRWENSEVKVEHLALISRLERVYH
jgi:hypothetical protein